MEIWFGIMARKVLRGANLTVVSELKMQLKNISPYTIKLSNHLFGKSVKLLEARSKILSLTYAVKH